MLEAMILAVLVVGGASMSSFDFDVPQPEEDIPDTEPTDNSDRLQLGGEDDSIDAGRGNDQVAAGAGDDTVAGGLGKDVLLGEAGHDQLAGGEFHDILLGGEGDDLLEGEGGKDILLGGSGDDTVLGGDWDDVISGDAGSDLLEGGRGNDNIFGVNVLPEPDVDTLRLLREDEETAENIFTLTADEEADTLIGGDGHDYLALGAGDSGNGGTGRDVFELHLEGGSPDVIAIEDYEAGTDSIRIAGADTGGFIVEQEDGSGDALIFDDGTLVARLTGAGGSFGLEQLEFTSGA
ncbi:calcium-binding protein [Leisingera sp. ANG-Vp]|uniref:calcium-binding protein n=1 Tax=Leisingera sp. ANG-Vp TaxID=1577896 RepID=UPI00068E1B10|nr:calcium-binding protein [Leisingera sp. ANG-Vp]